MNAQKIVLSLAYAFFRIAVFILVVMGVWRIGEYSYKYSYAIISDTAMEEPPGKNVRVSLTSEMSGEDTAKLLKRKGLIGDAGIFYLQLKVNDYDEKLQAGSYELNTSMTPKEMMAVMAGETEEDEDES